MEVGHKKHSFVLGLKEFTGLWWGFYRCVTLQRQTVTVCVRVQSDLCWGPRNWSIFRYWNTNWTTCTEEKQCCVGVTEHWRNAEQTLLLLIIIIIFISSDYLNGWVKLQQQHHLLCRNTTTTVFHETFKRSFKFCFFKCTLTFRI